jgi:hypothetical protein
VFGGKDIGIGHLNNLWCMNLQDLDRFVSGETEYHPNSEWELIETSGVNKPPRMSNHTSVEYGGKMYLFGGSFSTENLAMYSLDLNRYQWILLKPKGYQNDDSNLPHTRDEHSCVIHNDTMLVFGGFAFGERTNTIFRYHFKMN